MIMINILIYSNAIYVHTCACVLYQVCIAMYSGNTTSSKQTCLDTSTMSWHVPVSIGSSIRAVLALSIIVFIVLLSRCSSIMRSHHHHYYHNHAHKSLDSKKPKSEYITPSPYNGSQDISNVNILNDDNNIYRMVHKKYMRDNDRLHNSSYIQCVHDRDKIHSNVKQDVSQVCTGINNPTSFLEIQNHSSILQATNLDRTTIKTIYVEEPHVPAYGQKTTAARQTRLAYLYSIHDSIRSTPDESTQPIHTNIPDIYHPTRSKSPWSPHVSISTLPPEVQISDPQIPVCHLLCKASDKTNNQVGTVRYA